MENSKEDLQAFTRRVAGKIFEKVLLETPKNQTLVGSDIKNHPKCCYYQPHNYRLYFEFSKENFNPQKPSLVSLVYNYRIKNSKEHEYDNFLNCRIRVKKNQIEITNKIEPKKWYIIELKSTTEIEKQIKGIIEKKDKESIEVLKEFIKLHGGNSNFEILNKHSEDKIMGEDKIDLLPLKMKFQTSIVKKVYNEKNVEFSNPVFAATYLQNRAVEEITPEIAQEISNIGSQQIPLLSEINEGIKILSSKKLRKPTIKTDQPQARITLSLLSQYSVDNLKQINEITHSILALTHSQTALTKTLQSMLPEQTKEEIIPKEKPDYFG